MYEGSRKDGALHKNCGQESYGFRNARGERMSYFRTDGDKRVTECRCVDAPLYYEAGPRLTTSTRRF